jgi:archaellum biogenesis protein FlaJ (TadC family)
MVYSTVIFNAVVMSVAGGSMVKVFPFGGIMFLISAFCLLALAFWYRESLDLCASLMKVWCARALCT